VRDDVIAELAAFDFRRAFHEAGEIVAQRSVDGRFSALFWALGFDRARNDRASAWLHLLRSITF